MADIGKNEGSVEQAANATGLTILFKPLVLLYAGLRP
jgi:hypothetical protein